MRKVLALSLLMLWAAPAGATIIATDSAGDGFGIGIMDLVQLEADSDGTDLVLTLTINGDVAATNWGKYLFSIDTAPGGGMSQIPVTNPPENDANPWIRDIAIANPAHLAEYFIGSWVDGGGAGQLWEFTGVGGVQWNLFGAPGMAITPGAQSTIAYTMPLASLGLNVGDTIYLEAYSTGGGDHDTAVDTVNNPAEDWNPPAGDWGADAAVQNSTPYTIVPEPGTIALLLLGAFVAVRRR